MRSARPNPAADLRETGTIALLLSGAYEASSHAIPSPRQHVGAAKKTERAAEFRPSTPGFEFCQPTCFDGNTLLHSAWLESSMRFNQFTERAVEDGLRRSA